MTENELLDKVKEIGEAAVIAALRVKFDEQQIKLQTEFDRLDALVGAEFRDARDVYCARRDALNFVERCLEQAELNVSRGYSAISHIQDSWRILDLGEDEPRPVRRTPHLETKRGKGWDW